MYYSVITRTFCYSTMKLFSAILLAIVQIFETLRGGGGLSRGVKIKFGQNFEF